MTKRTITIDTELIKKLEGNSIPMPEIFSVLGYMTWWGGSAFTHVEISIFRAESARPEIAAYYTNPLTKGRFMLVAIYNPETGTFSTHS